MKKLCLAFLLISSFALAAFTKPTPPLTSTAPPPEPKKKEAPKPKLIIPSETSKKVIPAGDYFNHPGLVGSKNGQWIGEDNFTNISHAIALQVNIVKPETLVLPFKKDDLQSKIADIFTKSGITINTAASESEPPLPFFNMMVLAYPINDGVVIAVQGRLFESVELKRVILDKNTLFQAVTWEQTNLIVAPEEDIQKLSMNAIEQIASSFSGRIASAPTVEK